MGTDIPIRANFYWDFVSGHIRQSGGLTASRTNLGWVLNGKAGPGISQRLSVNVAAAHVLQVKAEEISLHDQLRKFWEVEEVSDSAPKAFDSSAFAQEIVRDVDRFYVPLPMKPGMREKLPTNLNLCVKRVWSLLKRLKKNPEKLAGYDRIIKKQEQ